MNEQTSKFHKYSFFCLTLVGPLSSDDVRTLLFSLLLRWFVKGNISWLLKIIIYTHLSLDENNNIDL